MVSILNIISLVSTSSSNNNNNDNNNNINDNQGNDNGAQNAESNTNNGMMAVTQVMQVPPGAGRRKRSENGTMSNQKHATLHFGNNTLTLKHSEADPIIAHISSHIDEAFLNQIGIGVIMSMNNWHYINTNFTHLTKPCLCRNLCEMSYNCAVFGDGAKLVSSIISHVISRDLAETDEEEIEFLKASDIGSRLIQSCESVYARSCQNHDWNFYTNNVRNYVHGNFKDKNYPSILSM